jgi:hypothetical protein
MTKETDVADVLARMSDRICSRILHEEIEWIDVQIEIEKMRDLVRQHAPEKQDLFERLYETRFRRLWEQWHEDRPRARGW